MAENAHGQKEVRPATLRLQGFLRFVQLMVALHHHLLHEYFEGRRVCVWVGVVLFGGRQGDGLLLRRGDNVDDVDDVVWVAREESS